MKSCNVRHIYNFLSLNSYKLTGIYIISICPPQAGKIVKITFQTMISLKKIMILRLKNTKNFPPAAGNDRKHNWMCWKPYWDLKWIYCFLENSPTQHAIRHIYKFTIYIIFEHRLVFKRRIRHIYILYIWRMVTVA